MKFLHTSDWHLGKRIGDFSRLEEQEQCLEEIHRIAEENQVDCILVAGDIFDTFNPGSDAVELLYRYLKKLANQGKRPVLVIAGNHDQPDRISAPDPLARECGIFMCGFPYETVQPVALDSGVKISHAGPGWYVLQCPQVHFPLIVLHTAYANEMRMRQYLGNENPEAEMVEILAAHWKQALQEARNAAPDAAAIWMGHFFFSGQNLQEDEEEKSILYIGGAASIPVAALPGDLQYGALGHIHGFHDLPGNSFPLIYSSSILPYSVDDPQQQKQVVIGEIAPGKPVTYRKIPLESGRKILRKRAENKEDALKILAENADAYIELTFVTDDFITAADKKELYAAHPYIIQLIPEIRGVNHTRENVETAVLQTGNPGELFEAFYLKKKGVQPTDKVRELFVEVMEFKKIKNDDVQA